MLQLLRWHHRSSCSSPPCPVSFVSRQSLLRISFWKFMHCIDGEKNVTERKENRWWKDGKYRFDNKFNWLYIPSNIFKKEKYCFWQVFYKKVWIQFLYMYGQPRIIRNHSVIFISIATLIILLLNSLFKPVIIRINKINF